MYRCKGTITVFLSLISVLFLSLLDGGISQNTGNKGKSGGSIGYGDIFNVWGI